MKSKNLFIITLFVLFIIVVGIVLFVIFFDKNDKEEVKSDLTFYVSSIARDTTKRVVTNFVVVRQFGVLGLEKEVVFDGKTSLGGLEEVKISFITNSSYHILNYGGDYYTNTFVRTNQNKITLELYRIGELNITLINRTTSIYTLRATVNDGQYRQISFCLKRTIGYLDVWSNNFNEIQTPQRLQSEFPDKCYYTFTTLGDENASLLITLNYKLISGGLESYDNIELIFSDADRSYENKYIIEDINGNDVGGPDYRFKIENLL